METIESVNDFFFKEEKKEDEGHPHSFLTENYNPRQVGSIVKYVEPLNVSAPIGVAMEIFGANPELDAIPVEEWDRVMGIVDRDTISKLYNSITKRITSKSVGSYISASTDLIMLDASDYIEKDLQRITEINKTYGIANFPVFDSKNFSRSFLGIANLNSILQRITEIREQDLEKAASVQTAQFPTHEELVELPYKLTAWNRMANSLGGDIYQTLRINENESFIGLFDVSGKNVAASLLTMVVATFFKINNNNNLFSNKPISFVATLDKHLAEIIPAGNFITGVLCYVNTKHDLIYLFNCGHTITYLNYGVPEEPTKTVTIDPKLPPFGLGIIGDELQQEHSKDDKSYTIVRLQKNIHIDIYSDGLTDMYNKQFEIYGDDRAKLFFNNLYTEETENLSDVIGRTIDNFTSETVIPDDITLIDIRF